METPTKRPSVIQAPPSKYADDIECMDWLEEVALSQYTEVFLTNFGVGGNLLSRKRLSQVRLKDFPFMNITNYEHQKLLMNHIQHSLQYAYQSPVRKKEVEAKYGKKKKKVMEEKTDIHSLKNEIGKLKLDGTSKRADHSSSIPGRRRRSFDTSAWQTIEKLRTSDNVNAEAASFLREGKIEALEAQEKKTHRRRRWTFGDESTDETVLNADKGTLYGNMALEYDIMQRELNILQEEYLNQFRNIIRCERASILFVNERTRQLMLFDKTWFRIPMSSGIAGYCAETGESLNIPDAYADYRFNQNVDIKTGFRTRNVLCQPVRSHRGGGSVIAVIQMLNKLDETSFNDDDVDQLAICAQRVADDINAKFRELLHAAEKFAGHAVFIGERGSRASEKRSDFNAPTAASIAGRASSASGHR